MSRRALLRAIGTAVPAKSYDQEFALEEILRLVGDTEAKRSFLTRVYRHSGIRKRHSVVEDYGMPPESRKFHPRSDDLLPAPGTDFRNDFWIEHASPLAVRAAKDLQASAPEIDVASATHLVTVSCTGFSAPGFDFDLIGALGLSPDVERFHVAFMGCYGAFPALRLARSLVEADPSARVLVVCVEICSVHFRLDWDPELQVANALFADGAACAWVDGTEGPGLRLEKLASRVAPASASEMTWKIGSHGFDMRLSSYVPKILQSHLLELVDPVLRVAGGIRNVAAWAIHPGGRAILDRSAEVLGIPREALRASDETLADFGNMSSATVLFVLRRLLESGAPKGPWISAAFGPGLTVESACFTAQ